ncbi:MAG: hypothetical protein U1E73_02070 [Planctomycetota bacterium]
MTGECPNDPSRQPETQLPPALLSALRTGPARLDMATVARLRDGIRERIVDACEQSELGRALEACMPVAHVPVGEDANTPPVGALGEALVERLRSVPLQSVEWSDVRAAVFAPAGRAAAGRRVARTLLLVGAGVAAVAALSLMLRTEPPQIDSGIAIADLQSLPTQAYSSPIALLRRGAGR